MLLPICQVGEWEAYTGTINVTPEMLDGWVESFGENEKIPVVQGHLPDEFELRETAEAPLCWVSEVYRAGDYLLGMFTDWTSAGRQAALDNQFKNFSIEADDSRLTAVAALGAFDSAVDFATPDGERFQPFDFAKGTLGEDGRLMLAAALGMKMPEGEWEPPSAGEGAPKEIQKILDKVYKSCRDKNPAETPAAKAKCAKIAWGAVKNAGWKKNKAGEWHKTKTAATAAIEGGLDMAEQHAAEAAEEKKSVLARLTSWLAPGESAAEEVKEPEVKADPKADEEPKESPEVTALKAEVGELKTMVTNQRAEFAAASLVNESKEICAAAKASPRFVPLVAQLMASIPADRKVALDEAGENETTAREAFKSLLLAKGTQKLEDPAELTKPPAKKEVEKVDVEKFALAQGPQDMTGRQKIVDRANVLMRTEKLSREDATVKALAEWEEKEA